ncbi:lysophospholipid acyltransferase family protein [Kutzneria albida]|uniref:Phospholipid/glycerol acyltransferase n=1 Tax=Kutzneria albida DSM 43870 TaxID=1449976 RepID=W5W6V4_9PSEU|nr:lysophospholipid acyltransferase family protein [Kutzneria albida]AHH96241.1 phospholipid/glycerol acyltransferase [Kutzneria albida DSM 43870]
MSGELPEGSWPRLHGLARWLGTWIFTPFYRLRVRGAENVPRTGPVLVVANHSTMLEGPILFAVLPRRPVFLIKQEMFKGLLGKGLRRIGQIALRRDAPDRGPLMTAVRVLRSGGLVGIFPEGTRGAGDVDSAHNGAAWLARSSGAVVVPVACRGTLRPDGAKRRFRPVVDVLVGDPFELPADKGRAALTAATERVRGELAALVAELDRRRDSGPGIGASKEIS